MDNEWVQEPFADAESQPVVNTEPTSLQGSTAVPGKETIVSPDAEKLLEIATCAERLAKTLRDYCWLDGATAAENPARLLWPRGSGPDDPEFKAQVYGQIEVAGTAFVAMQNLVSQLTFDFSSAMPDNEGYQFSLAFAGVNARPDASVKGWPFEVMRALKALQTGCKDVNRDLPKAILPVEEVVRIEAAAAAIRTGVEETTADENRPQGTDDDQVERPPSAEQEPSGNAALLRTDNGQADPFIPTPLQKSILHALNGHAMRKEKLAEECKVDPSRLYKPGGIKELRDNGKVDRKNGIGYYRPDAPPNAEVD
jgi:hypothetical protein